MGTAKDHFLKDKKARDMLSACTHADWFQHALILAASDMSDSGASAEQMRGARMFRDVLLNFAEVDEPAPPIPGPGLDHNLDEPRQDPPALKGRKSL